MSGYVAPNRLLVPMRHSIDTLTDSWAPAYAGGGSAAWPTANLAIYAPLRIPSRVVVKALWFAAAGTGTGNVDMALYDAAGVAVAQATATAKVAAAEEQVFDVADVTVGPGRYYIGLASNSGTDTFARLTHTAPVAAAIGLLTEANAYPLPSTATWAVNQTLGLMPIMGVLLTSIVA